MDKQDIELTIESVGRRGDGVGSFEGRPVYVPGVLPGERVRVRLLDDRDKGWSASLLDVITPNPERVKAPCPVYDLCGGCSLQHWDIGAYRAWKSGRLIGLLQKAGLKPQVVKDPVFIPEGARRRATLAAIKDSNGFRFGFHRARSHDVTNVPDCMMLTPTLRKLVDALRPYLQSMMKDGSEIDVFMQDTGLALDVMITGALAKTDALAAMADACGIARISLRADEDAKPKVVVRRAPVLKQSGGLRVELPPGAFLQPSIEGENALVAAVMQPLQDAGARRMADLFAGCGTFAGHMVKLGSVYAAESDDAPVEALNKAGAKNLKAERRNLFSKPLAGKDLTPFDAVVIDPPRMGAEEQARELASSPVPLVVSVSCNPTTFVRDAAILVAGGYRFESVQVVDQFIWSSHTEMVGVFVRSVRILRA